jgi:hypothetical protein
MSKQKNYSISSKHLPWRMAVLGHQVILARLIRLAI